MPKPTRLIPTPGSTLDLPEADPTVATTGSVARPVFRLAFGLLLS